MLLALILTSNLIVLLIGLLLGFYGRAVYLRLEHMYSEWRYQHDVQKAGVVKPEVSRVTKNQPVSMDSETGPVMRPSPEKIAFDAWRRDHPKN